CGRVGNRCPLRQAAETGFVCAREWRPVCRPLYRRSTLICLLVRPAPVCRATRPCHRHDPGGCHERAGEKRRPAFRRRWRCRRRSPRFETRDRGTPLQPCGRWRNRHRTNSSLLPAGTNRPLFTRPILWKFASVELLFVACRTQRATTSEQQFVCAVSSQKVNPILISPLLASDHIPYREEDDLNIEAEAPVLHVHHVVLHALLHETGLAGFTAVTVNLGIAGDTGRHEVPYAIAFNLLGVFFQLADHVGPGADDGHVAQEYVHKLRQLV